MGTKLAKMAHMNVLVSQPISESGIFLLKKHFNVEVSPHKLKKEELIAHIRNKEALVCSYDYIDEDILCAAEKLKMISSVSVGVEKIDIRAAAQKNIIVTNVRGTLDQTVAEFVFLHILAVSRHLTSADAYVRRGEFKQWSHDLFLGREIYKKSLGIIGLGMVGKALVPIAKGFGMEVLYTNRTGALKEYGRDSNILFGDMHFVLANSDYVVLLVPLTKKTTHLITYKELSLMKKDAILINMSRGPVVSENDLVRALQEGVIGGACLDVFEHEPKVADGLLKMSNVVLTPHIGSATVEARSRMAECAAQNVIDVLSGNGCQNIVTQ